MNNKTFALIFCLSGLMTLNSFASTSASDSTKTPEKKEMKTLLGSNFKIKSWGFSVTPYAQFGQAGKQNGLSALFHLNNNWGIGMSMMGTIRRNDAMSGPDGTRQHFGGLHIEYIPKSNALLHVTFPLIVGMVAQEKDMTLAIPYPTDPLNSNTPYPSRMDRDRRFDNFDKSFGIQPGINLELNLFKYAKLFGGVNYRFAFGQYANENIQGLNGQFGFKFGVFNKKYK